MRIGSTGLKSSIRVKRKPNACEEDDGDHNTPKADRHADKKILRDFGELSLNPASVRKPGTQRRNIHDDDDEVMRQSTSYDKDEHTVVVTSLEDDEDDPSSSKNNPNFSILSDIERRLNTVPNLLLDRATKVLQTRQETEGRDSGALVLYRNPEYVVQTGISNHQAGREDERMDIE